MTNRQHRQPTAEREAHTDRKSRNLDLGPQIPASKEAGRAPAEPVAAPPSGRNQRKWRNIFVRTNVQLKIAATNLMYMLLVVAVVVITVLVPQYLEIFQSTSIEYQHASAKLFLALLDRMVTALAAILIVAFVHQILMTHKFCGPLVNFVTTFRKIAAGDLTRKVHLRRYDFLKSEAAEINQMMDALAQTFERIKAEHAALHRDLASAEERESDPQLLRDKLAAARIHADNCRRCLDAITLPAPSDAAPAGGPPAKGPAGTAPPPEAAADRDGPSVTPA